MARRKTIPEIFEAVTKEATVDAKAKVLKEHESQPLLTLLVALYGDKQYVWDLPEGAPPYKTDKNVPVGMTGAMLFSEARRLYIFDKGYTKVGKMKKEALFIGMLEGLHHEEAELLIQIKDRKLSDKWAGVTKSVVKKAFPKLLLA